MKEIIRKIIPNNLYMRFSKAYRTIPFYFFRIFKIQNNKIVFDNFEGRGYGDNPKYIADEIIRQNLKYDMVWLVKDEQTKGFPKEIRIVKIGTIRACFELATAKVWIDNIRKSTNVVKRKEQYYIQTWHGAIPIKKIEKDAEQVLSDDYVAVAKNDSRIADLFVSSSLFTTQMYRRAFWYEGEIMECGYPRNDILFGELQKYKNKIYNHFKVPSNKKLVLYAPTFRKSRTLDAYNIDYLGLTESLSKRFDSDWIILIRLHPSQTAQWMELNCKKDAINATLYPDMQELMAASDVLITDYSSTMFEFSLTGRPVFLYASDIEEYKNDRNFYFNLNDLPYSIAENNEELTDNIMQFSEQTYRKSLDNFMVEIGIRENGLASKKIVERIISLI